TKVAVVPIYDPDQSKGGIYFPVGYSFKRETRVFAIINAETGKQIDEAENQDRAEYLVNKYRYKGTPCIYRPVKKLVEDQPNRFGERCDQGIVKYIGPKVKTVKPGDYVFFSGYTGTLVRIESECKLIIKKKAFIMWKWDNDYDKMPVPCLFVKSRRSKGEELQHQATYEAAAELLTRAFTDLNQTVHIHSPKQTEDFDYLVEDESDEYGYWRTVLSYSYAR